MVNKQFNSIPKPAGFTDTYFYFRALTEKNQSKWLSILDIGGNKFFRQK